MNGWDLGGLLAGSLALIALEVIVTSGASGAIADLLAWPGQLAAAWMNPAVPLIAQRAASSSAAATSSAAANAPTAATLAAATMTQPT